METCDISLGDLIEQRDEEGAGPLEPTKIMRVCIDVCKALDYLHTKVQLLHGDLKSYNVLIKNAFEQCKLCDFGVSLPLNKEGFVDLDKNPKARYVGTDIFSAPEVFNAPPEDISEKCDIFSFGLIIFECLTLRPPHYEHLEATNVSGMSSEFDSFVQTNRMSVQSKKLFSDSPDAKENQLNMSTVAEIMAKKLALNESCNENSLLMKSTAATIGDDSIQDITGTTFNGTINTATDESFTSSSTNRKPMRDVSNSSFNSTIGSEADYSVRDKSALNDTSDALEPWLGTRPRLPETEEFDENYFIFCETFYVCTHAMPDDRPSAGDLLLNFQKCNN